MLGRGGLVKTQDRWQGRGVRMRGACGMFVGRARHGTLSWLLSLTVALAAAQVGATEPTPEERTTARQLAFEGNEALRSKDYALAVDRFQRADALVHAPTLMLDLGRAYLGLGQLVNAHEAFQQILREGVPPNALPAWRRALAAARKEDAAVEPRLAWVTIRVQGSDAPRVTLDQEEVSTASLGVKRAVDPGRRTVTAAAEGFLPATTSIDLGEGQVGELDLVLERDPSYVAPSKSATRPPPPRVIVVAPPPAPDQTPAYIAFGVSGAGFVLSGVTTALMLRERSDLEARCKAKVCDNEYAGEVTSYRTYGTLAAVGLGVGVVGAGLGTYFWLSGSSSRDEQRSAFAPVISPTYVGMSGRF